jgi:hypothetical protein
MKNVTSVKGYTRLHRINSEDARKELNMCSAHRRTEDYKEKWLGPTHLNTTGNERLGKLSLQYHPRGYKIIQEDH